MIAILLADGFEEIEALTPLDILRRAGLNVKTVGVGGKVAVGSHKIPVIADMTEDEVNLDEVSMVILPGGMPGSINLDASPFTDKIIDGPPYILRQRLHAHKIRELSPAGTVQRCVIHSSFFGKIRPGTRWILACFRSPRLFLKF